MPSSSARQQCQSAVPSSSANAKNKTVKRDSGVVAYINTLKMNRLKAKSMDRKLDQQIGIQSNGLKARSKGWMLDHHIEVQINSSDTVEADYKATQIHTNVKDNKNIVGDSLKTMGENPSMVRERLNTMGNNQNTMEDNLNSKLEVHNKLKEENLTMMVISLKTMGENLNIVGDSLSTKRGKPKDVGVQSDHDEGQPQHGEGQLKHCVL